MTQKASLNIEMPGVDFAGMAREAIAAKLTESMIGSEDAPAGPRSGSGIEAAGIKPGPSDSLLSKTLTEGEQRSIATKQSTDPEGNSRTETTGGAV